MYSKKNAILKFATIFMWKVLFLSFLQSSFIPVCSTVIRFGSNFTFDLSKVTKVVWKPRCSRRFRNLLGRTLNLIDRVTVCQLTRGGHFIDIIFHERTGDFTGTIHVNYFVFFIKFFLLTLDL